MAKYMNNGAVEDYNYVAFLCHQLRHFTKQFEEFKLPDDEKEIKAYAILMDDWLKYNVIKIVSLNAV